MGRSVSDFYCATSAFSEELVLSCSLHNFSAFLVVKAPLSSET